MANDLNLCQFIGRLGRDPDVRDLPSGDTVANLSIAVGSKWKTKDGETKESTEWVRVSAFGKLAEICAKYLTKGQQVYVAGKMTTREYEKDGEKRYSTEIRLEQMQMLGGRQEGDGDERRAPAPAPAARQPQAQRQMPSMDDDSIPF